MTGLKRYFISEDEINKVIAGENIPLTAVTLRQPAATAGAKMFLILSSGRQTIQI